MLAESAKTYSHFNDKLEPGFGFGPTMLAHPGKIGWPHRYYLSVLIEMT